jgi:hypothetical protein
MSDGIHLNKESLDKVVDHVIQSVEEHFVLKKRGPTEKAARPTRSRIFPALHLRAEREGSGGAAGGRAGAVASALSACMGRTKVAIWKSFF